MFPIKQIQRTPRIKQWSLLPLVCNSFWSWQGTGGFATWFAYGICGIHRAFWDHRLEPQLEAAAPWESLESTKRFAALHIGSSGRDHWHRRGLVQAMPFNVHRPIWQCQLMSADVSWWFWVRSHIVRLVFAIVHLALLDRCQRCVQTGPLMAPCASWSWLLQVAFRVCPRLGWDSSWLRKFLGFNPSNKLKSWEKQLTILTTSLLRYGFWISMKLIDISICMHRWYKVISSCIYICMIPARSHCSILSWGGDFDDRSILPRCAWLRFGFKDLTLSACGQT